MKISWKRAIGKTPSAFIKCDFDIAYFLAFDNFSELVLIATNIGEIRSSKNVSDKKCTCGHFIFQEKYGWVKANKQFRKYKI